MIDQARAWSEAESGTLREYLTWAQLQASESTRVAETILPETDDDAVRIMTVHAAKGLEFPVTILSGMTTATRGSYRRVELAFPPDGPAAIKVGSDLVTPEFEAFKPIDEQMDFHERLRLLYVACTRARDHLVVSLHRKTRASAPNHDRNYTSAELIARACGDAPHQQELTPRPTGWDTARGGTASPAPPPFDDWDAERSSKLAASSVRRTVAATDLVLLDAGGEADEDTRAGFEKDPRDLELPPWRKGRYGTAVGRAVHAALQSIDLATGDGLEEAAAAQAAAEGILGSEADIATLAGAALDSPTVHQALSHQRWRETYVATPVGDRIIEGYIDLLYRTDQGLVVVDYKTAGAGADLDRRVEYYRRQGGAYALAVAGATGEPVVRVVFVFLTEEGPVDRPLPDLEAAADEVRRVVGHSGLSCEAAW